MGFVGKTNKKYLKYGLIELKQIPHEFGLF
jgi:hypothetical protein